MSTALSAPSIHEGKPRRSLYATIVAALIPQIERDVLAREKVMFKDRFSAFLAGHGNPKDKQFADIDPDDPNAETLAMIEVEQSMQAKAKKQACKQAHDMVDQLIEERLAGRLAEMQAMREIEKRIPTMRRKVAPCRRGNNRIVRA